MATPDNSKHNAAEEIKEWHFHVYWLEKPNGGGFAQADALRRELLALVEAGVLVAVCHGVGSAQLPGLVGTPPPMNRSPVGPHPSGSFETWVPVESLARALSFFTLRRGALSVFVHPLTARQRVDHSPARAFWLGPSWPIDDGALPLDPTDPHADPPFQYPELGLGYSRAA